MEMLSKNNEIYKSFKDLIKSNKTKDITISSDLEVLELSINNNIEIDTLFVCDELIYSDYAKGLKEKLISYANNTYYISKSSFEALALKENHAGLIASIKLNSYTYNDFKNKEFIVVLDRLEIPGNMGTIYRTLDSIKVDGVIIIDPVTKINNINVTSSSRGCNLIIPTIVDSYDNALKYLLENDYDIYLGEPKLGLDYQSYDYRGKIAIVTGNERYGINEDFYNHKSKKVFIPMEGTQNSLNVGVATSILAYEAYMKRKN